MQQSLIPPPTVPRCFELLVSESGCGQLSGMAAVISQEPLSVSGVLDATCQLSEHLYRTMRLNSESEQVGSEEDLAQRRRYYNDIVNWRFTLPNHLKDEENFTFQTAFLRCVITYKHLKGMATWVKHLQNILSRDSYQHLPALTFRDYVQRRWTHIHSRTFNRVCSRRRRAVKALYPKLYFDGVFMHSHLRDLQRRPYSCGIPR